MRSLVAAGLILLVAAQAGPVRADPGTPQLAPLRREREDAQRLREQLPGLDEPAAEPAVAPRLAPDALRDPARDRSASTHDRPQAQRWWLWAALGAVVLTIGVTYEATRSAAPPLAGVTCDATGCRPS
jgi:hypothetical protein